MCIRDRFSRELYVDGDDFMEVPIKKYFRLFPGNEVRFKGAYFITCNEVVKNEDGSVKELLCTYDPETRSGSGFEGRKVKGTIHWVDAKTAVKIKIRNYDYLMVDDEEGNQVMNPDSLTESIGYAEPLVAEAKPDVYKRQGHQRLHRQSAGRLIVSNRNDGS